ncbi:hypothetical protein D3C72_1689970 [compost metagenome]
MSLLGLGLMIGIGLRQKIPPFGIIAIVQVILRVRSAQRAGARGRLPSPVRQAELLQTRIQGEFRGVRRKRPHPLSGEGRT